MNGDWIHDELLQIREELRIVNERLTDIQGDMSALKVKTGIMGSAAGLLAGLIPAIVVYLRSK